MLRITFLRKPYEFSSKAPQRGNYPKRSMAKESKPFRLQFMSDLHLEMPHLPKPHVERLAPNLALLGDIGYPSRDTYRNFLRQMSAQFERVFLVPGNHEYYKTTMEKAQEDMQDICRELPNVVLLNPGLVRIPEYNLRILGATLWSNVPTLAKCSVETYLNDYFLIHKNNGDLLTVEDTNRMHAEQLAWLTTELYKAKDAGEKALVLTHHAPLIEGTSHPRYQGKLTNCAFATDLNGLFPYVHTWLHGHTHYNHNTYRRWYQESGEGQIYITANQRGYSSAESQGFDPCRVIQID